MTTLTLKRTENGYQSNSVAVTQHDLSPRQTQFVVFVIGHAMRYKEASKHLGITPASVNQLAQQLFWKLRVNNLLEAANELHKRKMIEYLCLYACLLVISFTSLLPEAHATTERQPPRRARTSQIRRTSRRKEPKFKNAFHTIMEGKKMEPVVSMFATDIQAKQPERDAINDAINAPHNGTKHPIKINVIPRGVSAYTPKEKDEKSKKRAIKKRRLDSQSSLFGGNKNV